MRRIVVTEFLTLDGVMEAPNLWSGPYWSDETAAFKREELFAADALLLGRVTYEGFAAAWPGRTDPGGFAERMNGLPKYVASTTLAEATWQNSQVLAGDVPDAVARLKEGSGGDVLVAGSATLVRALLRHGLVDELRLLVYPVLRGEGKRLFDEDVGVGAGSGIALAEARALGTGVVALRYRAGAAHAAHGAGAA